MFDSNRSNSPPENAANQELRRSLGVFDAVVIGLGSMIGAGIFAALGPAARAAGSALLLGLAVAAVVVAVDSVLPTLEAQWQRACSSHE